MYLINAVFCQIQTGMEEKNQLKASTVIARPQAVAISRYAVRICTQYQEIATSLRSSR